MAVGASSSLSGTNNLLSWAAGAAAVAKKKQGSGTGSGTSGTGSGTTGVGSGTATSQPPVQSGFRFCDANIQASSSASCPFAANVFTTLYSQWSSGNPGPYSLTVYSPVTGRYYDVMCQANAANTMICTNQSDTTAVVKFPVQALAAYTP